MITYSLHCLFLIGCFFGLAHTSFADSGNPELTPKYFTFTFENDLFVGEDDGYTNGIGLTFGQGPFLDFNQENLPNWLYWLTQNMYISTMENKTRGIANMFFQRMQTPTDITIEPLVEDDLPYVGLLAWQGTMYAWDDKVSDQLSFYIGAVGPVALGEESQKAVHSLLGSDEPLGWDNQIENELVVKIEAQRVWNLFRTDSNNLQFDVLGLAGIGVGNFQSATKAGFAFRWGKNLQRNFATFSLQADRQVNPLALSPSNDFYIFAGLRGGYLANDIFIDGNTFENSHSVPIEHIQNDISAGVVWNVGRCGFIFQVTSSTSQTTLTDEREKFGGFSVTLRH